MNSLEQHDEIEFDCQRLPEPHPAEFSNDGRRFSMLVSVSCLFGILLMAAGLVIRSCAG